MAHYIKKFIIDNKEHTVDISKVREAIKNKKDVRVILSWNKLTSKGYDGVTNVFKRNEKYFIEIGNTTIETEGMDDNKREAEREFLEFFDRVTKEVLDLEEAKIAVAQGRVISARIGILETGKITSFLDDETFKTFSGSIYQII